MTDEYILIVKVLLEDSDKQFILVNVYCPPWKLNVLRNNNFICVLNSLIKRYKNPCMVFLI